MEMRKTVLFVGLMVAFLLLTTIPQVLAGGGPEPPSGAVIQDGELWGSVVVYCSDSTLDFVVVRVKRVVNCNVETQTIIEPDWTKGCSDNPGAPLDWSLTGVTFFDIDGTPFIKKVKNFKEDAQVNGVADSFDAQFKFWK